MINQLILQLNTGFDIQIKLKKKKNTEHFIKKGTLIHFIQEYIPSDSIKINDYTFIDPKPTQTPAQFCNRDFKYETNSIRSVTSSHIDMEQIN